MGHLYRFGFDHFLTKTDPERAHDVAFKAIRAAGPMLKALRLNRGFTPVHALGLTFPGPLGLAAGFDKNGEGVDSLAALGFSFVEVGTVTGEPQLGNEKPRLHRLTRDRAVVNWMGFNNDGAEAVAKRLSRRRRRDVIVGVNIGKTKAVKESGAIDDYVKSTRLLAPHADYLVVNVSSPNTPGLRDLQTVSRLRPLLTAVRRAADDVVLQRHVPLLVKIAPDLSDEGLLDVADLAVELGLDGIVATNTTTSRDGLISSGDELIGLERGGLSGAPLKERALEVVGLLRKRVGPNMVIIGVGGIATADDAKDRLDAGANLLQGVTGFIYEGPFWAHRVQRQLHKGVPNRMPKSGAHPNPAKGKITDLLHHPVA